RARAGAAAVVSLRHRLHSNRAAAPAGAPALALRLAGAPRRAAGARILLRRAIEGGARLPRPHGPRPSRERNGTHRSRIANGCAGGGRCVARMSLKRAYARLRRAMAKCGAVSPRGTNPDVASLIRATRLPRLYALQMR